MIDKKVFKQWMNHFIGDNEGKIKLINLYYSYKELVDTSNLRNFISDCLSLPVIDTISTKAGYQAVLCSSDKYFGLQKVDISTVDDSKILVTTMDSVNFLKLVKPPDTTVGEFLPPCPYSDDPVDEENYCTIFRKLTSKKNWWRDDAELGRKIPTFRPFWFCESDSVNIELEKDKSSNNNATKIRDILGLINYNKGTYLILVHILAKNLKKIPSIEIARPGYADQGNRRFAVTIATKLKTVYSGVWGLTVNLRKLGTKGIKYIQGVPERISTPIEMKHIGEASNPTPVGFVLENRGEKKNIDDDETFIKNLLQGREIKEITNELLEAISE